MKIEIEYDILTVNTGYTDKQKCVLLFQLPPMENADYCDDIKRLIMSMLQTDSVNRPNAKLVFDSISCHKCKNTAIHSTKEMSKVVPKGMIL